MTASFEYASTGHPLRQVGSTQWLHPIERYDRLCEREEAAFDLADAAPVDRRGVAVLLVAGNHAALAADAAAHVDVEAVLLAGLWQPRRHARVQCRRRSRALTARGRQTDLRRQDEPGIVFGRAPQQR